MGRNTARSLLLVCVSFFAAVARAEHAVDLSVEGGLINVSLPSHVKVGVSVPVRVAVRSESQDPVAVRARVGMPAHGHWIGAEGRRDFAPTDLEFVGEKCGSPPVSAGVMCLPDWFDVLFPMEGHYRIRVWLDYDDGRTSTAAADVVLEPDRPIELVEFRQESKPEPQEAHGGKHKH